MRYQVTIVYLITHHCSNTQIIKFPPYYQLLTIANYWMWILSIFLEIVLTIDIGTYDFLFDCAFDDELVFKCLLC